jgi:hypothetical protein
MNALSRILTHRIGPCNAGVSDRLAVAPSPSRRAARPPCPPRRSIHPAFLGQGNTKDALAKFDEARKCASNWKQLKEAREPLAKQPR